MTSSIQRRPRRAFTPRRRVRRAAAASLAAASALLLSACLEVTEHTFTQVDGAGDALVRSTLCITPNLDPGPGTPCRTGVTKGAIEDVQLVVAYLVPEGFQAPDALTGSGALADVTYAPSAEYTAAMNQGDETTSPPAGKAEAGHRWVGYASSVIPKARLAAAEQSPHTTITARFHDPSGAAERFTARAAFGFRWIRPVANEFGEALPASRPIVCGSATGLRNDGVHIAQSPTQCAQEVLPKRSPDDDGGMHPLRAEGRAALPGFDVLELSTLALGTPEPVKALASQAVDVRVPVTSRLAGAPQSVPVRVETDVPGAAVQAPATLALGASELTARVALPLSTGSGAYEVRFVAGEGSGRRTATAQLLVDRAPERMPDAQPEPAKPQGLTREQLGAIAKSLAKALGKPGAGKALRAGTLRVSLKAPAAGPIEVVLRGKAKGKKSGPVLAKGTAALTAGGNGSVKLKLTAAGRKALRALKGAARAKGVLVVRAGGGEAPARAITLRP